MVRAAGLALGQLSLLRDLGHDLPVRIWTDGSAAIGISSRQGLGKLRHLDCHTLWLQHRLRKGVVEFRKVLGERIPADVFPKHLESAGKLRQLMELFGCDFRSGRPEAAPKLKKDASKTNNGKEGAVPRGGDPTVETVAVTKSREMLPHMLAPRDMGAEHPRAVPWPEIYEEAEDI